MVFALQHTSSRESRALNVKLDELIRVSGARNELIGAEDESHDPDPAERREELLDERVTATERPVSRATVPGEVRDGYLRAELCRFQGFMRCAAKRWLGCAMPRSHG